MQRSKLRVGTECPAMSTYAPLCHYGYSPGRPSYTICGKDRAYVMITFFPKRVTCPACIDEVQGMEGVR